MEEKQLFETVCDVMECIGEFFSELGGIVNDGADELKKTIEEYEEDNEESCRIENEVEQEEELGIL